MNLSDLKKKRKLRLCYVDGEKRLFSTAKAQFEKAIGALGPIESVAITSVEDPMLRPCDLLVITADHVPDESIEDWLKNLKRRLHSQAKVPIPTLCFCSLKEKTLIKLIEYTIAENWYFDVIDPNHAASLAIRAANLLRIHDHIHELNRYASALDDLQLKVAELEKRVQDSCL